MKISRCQQRHSLSFFILLGIFTTGCATRSASHPTQAKATSSRPRSSSPLRLTLIRDSDSRFHIEAEAQVKAPLPIVIDTLRDYDHVSEFVPTVVLSRWITYQGQPAIEQVGRARFLLLSFHARTILREWKDPSGDRLVLHAVAGDFSTYDSTWTFHPAPTGTRILLVSQVVMKRWMPQWLARRELKKNVRLSLEALLAEMERRGSR